MKASTSCRQRAAERSQWPLGDHEVRGVLDHNHSAPPVRKRALRVVLHIGTNSPINIQMHRLQTTINKSN